MIRWDGGKCVTLDIEVMEKEISILENNRLKIWMMKKR
jgi:hypothetical protein